ncbi:MAG: hypothetical protein DHS20C02_08830 [Micavibrio sp.]|nr:MAG: hypothetical protein DHS20C02_08830 [Micavibrio sp.]
MAMKKNLKTLFAVTFMLSLGCVLSMPSIAGYRSGKAVQQIQNTKNQACVKQEPRALQVNLSRQDMRDMELAQSYMRYQRAQGQSPFVIKSLYRASIRTGVSFELLLLKASLESDMGRLNEAARSSARGVFQYIEPTWLILMNRYGAKIGHPEYAKAIKISNKQGFPYFKGNDKHLRSEILALRYDDDISALIKAYQIIEETDVIRGYKGGKKVSATDHYIAHMMGLNLAKDFYDLKRKNSILVVARLKNPQMREAAMLNKIFFYKKRVPLTAPQAYVQFERRVGRELKKIRNVAKYNGNPSCVFASAEVN